MANEPITNLPYQEAGSLQTDVLQNEQLNYFAAWFGTVVQTIGDTAPPVTPVNGQCYIIGTSATGAWSGKDNNLTVYRDGWQFYAPKEGARVSNLDDGKLYVYMSGAWGEYTIPASAAADNVSFDNSTSGLSATDVQAAIDELSGVISDDITPITEASAFSAATATHSGRSKLILAGGDVTFSSAESYSAGNSFNVRATAGISLLEDGVTLTPPAGGTLELDANMAVTVVMTSSTTGIVIGQTVAA